MVVDFEKSTRLIRQYQAIDDEQNQGSTRANYQKGGCVADDGAPGDAGGTPFF